jgi:hypothetical protein
MADAIERPYRLILSAVLICLMIALAAANFGSITTAESGASITPREIDIGPAWTGTRVGFGSVLKDAVAFIAYYDENRVFVVARIDLRTGTVERSSLGSIFAGWDSHNETAIAIDSHDLLHVVGNMHATPLVYFRGTEPLSIQNMIRAKMTGIDEAHVSYPQFFSFKDGPLAFAYRSGVSGDGLWYINVLDSENWHHISNPIFTNCAGINKNCGENTVSAYPSDFDHQSGNFFNLAIVWRTTPDVETNYRLSFARTIELFNWFATTGKPIPLPMAPDTTELVDSVGPDHGLVNNAQVATDTSGLPIIVYTKYVDDGRNGIFAAHPIDRGGWLIKLLATSKNRTEVRGRGSLTLPRFAFVGPSASELTVNFPNESSRTVDFNPTSLTLIKNARQQEDGPNVVYPTTRTENLVDPIISGSAPHRAGQSRFDVTFRWATQGLNSDLPRECSVSAPLACSPPATMLKAYVFPHLHGAQH